MRATAEARSIREVAALDHERVAFEVAAARALEASDILVDVRPGVERDHAGLVDHLVGDRHLGRALEDPDAVAVDDGTHAAVDAEADAAVVEREVLELVERTGPEAATARGGRRSRLAFIVHGRRAAVGRVDDE